MTDSGWRFNEMDDGDIMDDMGSSHSNVGRCPKHNFPIDIPVPPLPPPSSLAKATSLHNCTAVYDTSNGSPSTIVHHNPANICDRTNGGSSSRRLVDSSDRSHSVDEFRRPLMNDTQVQTKDDTTQCISLSNNGLLTGSGQAGAGTNSVQTATTTVSAGTGVRSSSERKRTRSGGASGSRRFKRRSKPFCLRATLNNFSTFCRQTSLHGWQYIAQKNSSRAKHVFWAIMVSMSMATAAVFLYNNTMDYLNATVVTTVDTMTVPLSEVFFPSVVVCNINQVRKSFFEELGIYDNETFIRQIYYDYIEGKSKTTLHSDDGDHSKPGQDEKQIALHEKILKEYLAKVNEGSESEQTIESINWVTHQKCKDMFILSKWNGTTTYQFEIERDFGTDYGICCWYTPQLNFSQIIQHQHENNLSEPSWGHWFTNIKKGAKTGKDNGYTMLFDIESFDYSYYDEGSEGLKVALVHHLDMPIMRQTGFHIAPGTENQIAVTPTLIVTSPNAMTRFTPAERDCYSEDEISLKYLPRDHGYRYEMSNCLFESAFENILRECKCFPGFHTMGGEHAAQHYEVCIGPNLTCMNDLMNRMGQFDHVEYKGKQVKCRSNCEDQINSLFVTTSSYPNRKTLIYREEFCILARRLLDKCSGPKKKPLEREYPNLCSILDPLRRLDQTKFCKNNVWDIPRSMVPNCTNHKCPVEDAILNYARENLVMFNIFIKDPYAKRFQKDEKITKTSYIANSGGLLGLCMGFSLISGAEILFHCFFGVYSAIFPSEKKKQRLKGGGGGKHAHHGYCCSHEYNLNSADSRSHHHHPSYKDSSGPTAGSASEQHCCNFQHIVQLQDGTTRSVLCSNLKMTPLRLRNQLSTTCHQMGNGSCVNINSTTTTTTMQCHNSVAGAPNNGNENTTKVYSGPERII